MKVNLRLLLCIITLGIISGCVIQVGENYRAAPVMERKPFKLIQTEESSLTKAELYPKARQWFSEYFVSGESVIDYENESEGVIIGNGLIVGPSPSTTFKLIRKTSFTIRVDIKDEKFRTSYTINNINDYYQNQIFQSNIQLSDHEKKLAEDSLSNISTSLKNYIESVDSAW